MTALEVFEELLRSRLWPELKSAGFKRSKGNFHRPVGRNWEVINFQKSTSSGADGVRFTVNLAVGVDRLRRPPLDWDEGKRPTEPSCQVRERLGFLLRDEDIWWQVEPETDIDALGDSLLEALRRYGLPWLEARSNDESLRDLLLAELTSLADHQVHLLGRLTAQLGPPAAIKAVERESERRGRD